MKNEKTKCPWCVGDTLMEAYHDNEWGVPVYDDTLLFEYLVLDAFQAGLSWKTILHRREHFRKAFANFDYKKVAKFDQKKLDALMQNEGIIRNKLKVYSSVTNAQLFMAVQKEYGSFAKYIWQFTKHKTINNKLKTQMDIPAKTLEAEAMSKDLRKREFKFVGPTICYAFMQAAGMVNDHLVECFRYKEVDKR